MIRSLLPIVSAADNLPSHSSTPYPTHSPDGLERYVPFHLTFADHQAGCPPLGLIRPHVLAELQAEAEAADQEGRERVWQFYYSTLPVDQDLDLDMSHGQAGAKRQRTGNGTVGEDTAKSGDPRDTPTTADTFDTADGGDELDVQVECVFFSEEILSGGPDKISAVLAELVGRWKEQGKFPGPLAGWRNEQYQLYYPSHSSAPSLFPATYTRARPIGGTMSNHAFTLERAACALFGLPTFGVHMTAYEYNELGEMMVWVPRRSRGKATWPGKLDNTVAGGITAGMRPLETMIKECDEEANLPEDFVRSRVRNVSLATYFYITDDGYLQPEVEYIYDLPLPPQSSPDYIQPRPHDDEVESFALMSIPDIRERLFAGEFKPNCGAILVDFFIRHNILTPENEPSYMEIRWSLGRRLGFSMPY